MFAMRNYVSKEVLALLTFRKTQKFVSVTSSRNKSKAANSEIAQEEVESNVVEVRFSEEEIERKRNKSRLSPGHRNILNGIMPDFEIRTPHHKQVAYTRRMYGIYGEMSGIDPSNCWPTQSELLLTKEYETVARPKRLQEMMIINIETKAAEEEKINKREEEIAQKLAKLEKWKEDMNNRIKKKEADAIAAKERKDRLIEEVRRHFGYKVDPRDERFKEILEKKEKEEKKRTKEAKKKAKEAKMLAQLLSASQSDSVKTS